MSEIPKNELWNNPGNPGKCQKRRFRKSEFANAKSIKNGGNKTSGLIANSKEMKLGKNGKSRKLLKFVRGKKNPDL